MLVALGALWIFLALLSGAALGAYVWQTRSDYAVRARDGGQGLRRAPSPVPAWSIGRADHA